MNSLWAYERRGRSPCLGDRDRVPIADLLAPTTNSYTQKRAMERG